MVKLAVYIVLGIALALLQVSFFATLPYLNSLNFILIFLVYLTIKKNDAALIFALISGYILDVYSSYPFGMHILALFAVNFLANYIYFRILTNHRFFPIIFLITICIAIYHFLILSSISVLSFLKIYAKTQVWSGIVIKNIGLEIAYSIFFISVIYMIFYIARKKLNIYLITHRKNYE